MSKTKKIVFIVIAAIVGIYVSLVIVRMFYFYNLQKTEEQVAKIHATKLSIDDVIGKNLPPDPGDAANATIEGVDANQNGIRDDVELAIFKEYPNSARTRAVLLQYALALQMEMTQAVVNRETVTEVVREQSRAGTCLADTLVPRKSPESSRDYSDIEKIDVLVNSIKEMQRNTEDRKQARKNFVKKIGSHSESENEVCDINLLMLPN